MMVILENLLPTALKPPKLWVPTLLSIYVDDADAGDDDGGDGDDNDDDDDDDDDDVYDDDYKTL